MNRITSKPGPVNGAVSAAGSDLTGSLVPFLMKDVVLLAVSFYLLKQDVQRASHAAETAE